MTSIASTPPAPAATTPSTTPSSTSAPLKTGLGSDLNTFLKLLTTQLKNQDPLSPVDTNQFTTQLVQFSQVEQAINENTKLASLVAMQSTSQTMAALPLVGHTIQFNDNQTALTGGQAKFTYNLPSTAANSTIAISNAAGKIVFSAPGQTAAGAHTFTWDGKGTDGSQLPDGIYTFNVAAAKSDKSAITAAITAYGKVDQVQVTNGTASLDIGGLSEALSKIVSISP